MDQIHVVKHKVMVEKHSQRAVALELGISRNTVRRYLAGAEPGKRKPTQRGRPVYGAVKARLDALLEDSAKWTAKKQRLTARRLQVLLVGEGHVIGYTLVKDHVAEWRRKRQEVFVPLVYRAGDLFEVDFFEVLVDVAGERKKGFMFLMRMMNSGRDFACIYPRQDQVCFLDGHVRAFTHFGGVASRGIYDNLRAAVRKILVGAERLLTTRFLAMAAHYVVEPCFARPATGHDKGGVESRGKAIRWQHLVPIPSGENLEQINQALQARLDTSMATTKNDAGLTVAARWIDEQKALHPLPLLPFFSPETHFLPVSQRSLCKVKGASYSLPSTWARMNITVHLGVDEVEFVGKEGEREKRKRLKGGERDVDYRHYLRELSRKPQALRQVADVLCGQLGEPYPAMWAGLIEEHGEKEGARVFARVLEAAQTLGLSDTAARIRQAMKDQKLLITALFPLPIAKKQMAAQEIPESLRNVVVIAANVAEYDLVLGGVA